MLIDIDYYDKEEMYLIFSDDRVIDMSKERVRLLVDEYWNDPAKLPLHERQKDVFKTCNV